jgi:hypothetical protein
MPALAIDPNRSWVPLEARAAQEPEARTRALLTLVRDHMEHEIKGDLVRLMATLGANPVYHFRGTLAPGVLEGREAVEAFYRGMFATGRQQFEVVIEKIVATPDDVVTEGFVKQVHKGEALLAQGVPTSLAITAGALYLAEARLVTIWPNDGTGLLKGEDIYFGESPLSRLRRIAPEQLPPYYVLR